MLESAIQWTNMTVNFWIGCTRVSAGCRFCYMFRDAQRYSFDASHLRRTKPETFNRALSVHEPKLIFTCSWSDFFHQSADQWRADAWDVIRRTPWHRWQILTKRPERILSCLPDDWGDGWDNVWLGTTVENNQSVSRIHLLKQVPAKVRFISAEPLLENVDFQSLDGIHWLILGGESGNNTGAFQYRPMDLAWLESGIQQCKAQNIPVFVKQLGTHQKQILELKDRHGGDISEWPQQYQIREMPIDFHNWQNRF
jgi:protein gp37